MTMPDGSTTDPGSSTPETATAPATGQSVVTQTASATQAAPTDVSLTQTGNTVVLTSKTLKARLDKEKERGKKAALAEFESKARNLGYANAEEMFKAIEESKAAMIAQEPQPNAAPAQERQPKMADGKNGNGKSREADARSEREVERLRKQHEESERKRRHAEKQERLARKREEEARIEAQLARAAAQAGIRNDEDVDYAIHLLRAEVKNNPKKFEGTDTFDERKFFADLRETKPYLFGEAPRPATTGVTGDQPNPPKPGQVTTQTAQNGQFDARKASREEFNKELAKRGLRFNP